MYFFKNKFRLVQPFELSFVLTFVIVFITQVNGSLRVGSSSSLYGEGFCDELDQEEVKTQGVPCVLCPTPKKQSKLSLVLESNQSSNSPGINFLDKEGAYALNILKTYAQLVARTDGHLPEIATNNNLISCRKTVERSRTSNLRASLTRSGGNFASSFQPENFHNFFNTDFLIKALIFGTTYVQCSFNSETSEKKVQILVVTKVGQRTYTGQLQGGERLESNPYAVITFDFSEEYDPQEKTITLGKISHVTTNTKHPQDIVVGNQYIRLVPLRSIRAHIENHSLQLTCDTEELNQIKSLFYK